MLNFRTMSVDMVLESTAIIRKDFSTRFPESDREEPAANAGR
jgi:hypothetical protein